MMRAWLVNWTSAINTHTSAINTHTHTHNNSSLRFAVSCFVFFRAKCFLIQLLKFLFCRHPGKGVQYLLFVTASNSKILKSQLSSLSRSCTIQGGTSLMVFGTERRLWLRFTSVKMEFENYNISVLFTPPRRIQFRKQQFFKKYNSFPYMKKCVKAYNICHLYYHR